MSTPDAEPAGPPEEAAEVWVNENPDVWQEWLPEGYEQRLR